MAELVIPIRRVLLPAAAVTATASTTGNNEVARYGQQPPLCNQLVPHCNVRLCRMQFRVRKYFCAGFYFSTCYAYFTWNFIDIYCVFIEIHRIMIMRMRQYQFLQNKILQISKFENFKLNLPFKF